MIWWLCFELVWQVSVAMPALERGDFAAALPPLERACRNKENNGCYLLGRALLSLDRFSQAKVVLTRQRPSDPFPWRVDDALGLIAEATGDAAEPLFARAIAGNRNASVEPRLHYGQYLVRQGRPLQQLAPGRVRSGGPVATG